jgi:hypothetical protein
MATLRERLRARREAERRALRSFTVGISEDDLRLIAKHGYGGAVSTAPEQQAQAVGRFSLTRFSQSDHVIRRYSVTRDGVTRVTVSPCGNEQVSDSLVS